jgi:hypothetical protein
MPIVNFVEANLLQITGVVMVAILLSVGRSKILPAVKSHLWLMWIAFGVTIVCGLVLGWALVDLIAWLTQLRGAGAVFGSIGALIAFTLGWHGVHLLIALIRDVTDGRPDEDARKAALWVPTMLPAGWSAVWGVATHPQGIGTGIVAAIMAAITMIYTHRIVGEALKARKARKGWLWFAALVCLLAGIVATPLVLYLDGRAAAHLPAHWLIPARLVAGTIGLALGLAALKDIADKVPDQYVRSFLRFGLPILLTFGSLALGFFTGHAVDGGHITTGGFK